MAQHYTPSPTTQINPVHYKNLLEDDIYAFSDQETDLSDLTRTSDNSNVLHIAASTNQSENMINYIVQQSPILLTRPDSKGDIPIHVAVRAGHINVVRNLVNLANCLQNYNANFMLKHVNNEENTALHIALENQQKGMAEYLFEKCPNVLYCMNVHKICPIYLAIKAGFWELVANMVELCCDSDEFGARISTDDFVKNPVIHAAIFAKNKDILEKIIIQNPSELIHTMDLKGMRPLSYAAYIGFLDGVKCIINMEDDEANTLYRNQAFKTDSDGSFPVHSACAGGHIEVVRELLLVLPDTARWLLNKKGQSILHVAAESGKAEVVEYLLRKDSQVESMINMKDENGCTPLHLGAIGKNAKVVYVLTWDLRTMLHLQCKDGKTALDIAESYNGDVPSLDERLTWLALTYVGVPRSPQAPQNIEQTTTFVENEQILLERVETMLNHPRKLKHNKYKDRINTLLIISTLVATATFTSGFTVPGGFNNSNPNQGIATLDHRLAFKVFVISNTMAMYSAVLAMVTLIWAHLDDLRLSLVSLDIALPLLGIALGGMSVAFMMGVYVVLCDLVWLGVVVVVMGSVFLGVLFVFFMPFYCPTSFIEYRVMRCVFHVPFMLMLWMLEKGKV